MAKKAKQINLSDHTLDINTRKFSYKSIDFSELEDFVAELSAGRDYQFKAIKELLIYLWGGSYNSILDLAKENYTQKSAIQHRFKSEDNFIYHLPLPDKISGVVHMATGTGKSYVMFAIAYLSIVLGKVKRVLVLDPSSTVIESGLNAKFKEYLYGPTGKKLQDKLPQKYRNIPISLLNENEPIEDYSIVIENINSVYNRENNAIGDTLFKNTDEVLVLSDEFHHVYSHLVYSGNKYTVAEGGKKEIKNERLWMKFIREEPKIKRHIGFTGTPYNQDEYFVDVIYNYSIKDTIDDQIIKEINPIIKTEYDDGSKGLNKYQKFEKILKTHYLVIVSHKPEKDFVIKLIQNGKYIESWIKSRDMGFYSLEYEYWKGGKDRTRRSFNPDFFITINLENYIDIIKSQEDTPETYIYNIKKYQNLGIQTIIRVVEIKGAEEKKEVTLAKERAAIDHFKALNKKLKNLNPIDLPEQFQKGTNQYYIFDLLQPHLFHQWFGGLRQGYLPRPEFEN